MNPEPDDIPLADVEKYDGPEPKCWTCMDRGIVGALVRCGDGADAICDPCPEPDCEA